MFFPFRFVFLGQLNNFIFDQIPTNSLYLNIIIDPDSYFWINFMELTKKYAEQSEQRRSIDRDQFFQKQDQVQKKSFFVQKMHFPFQKETIQVSSLGSLQKISNMSNTVTNKTQWTPQEEQLLFLLHLEYGNKWSVISTHLPGKRSDNDAKNKFYSTLRKGFRKMNKYITNVRRKIYKSQIAPNKLLKPDFLTKLSAVADRNFEQKYEVKRKAIDLSQSLQQKLIELSKNTKGYQRNDSENFMFEQLLLAQIQQFNRNCKRRKGKRKIKGEAKRSEQVQSRSIVQSQMLDEQSEKQQVEQVKQKKQEHQQIYLRKQQTQSRQPKNQENQQIQQNQKVGKEALDKNNNFPVQDELNLNDYLKNWSNSTDSLNLHYGQGIKTPSVNSTHGSLMNFINPSPLNSGGSFHQAFLAFRNKIQTSLQISKNNQNSILFKSMSSKQKQRINFLQEIPMVKAPNNILFTSAQFRKICEVDNQSALDKRLSSSESFDDQRSFSSFRKSEAEASSHRFPPSKFNKKPSAIEEVPYLQSKQVQSQEKAHQ